MKKIIRFKTYFALTLRHSYFDADTLLEHTGLSFAPDTATAQALPKAGLTMRPGHSGFILVGRPDQSLPDKMVFMLLTQDPKLFLITSHDGSHLSSETAIELRVADGVQLTTLVDNSLTEQHQHQIGRLVVDHAEAGQRVEWFLPSTPVGQDFVVTSPLHDLDPSQCHVTHTDGTAVLTEQRRETLPDGRAAVRIAVQGLRPLHERLPDEDQLVLHFRTPDGQPKSIPLPAPNPNALAVVNGALGTTTYITV